MEASIASLESFTDEFFARHWSTSNGSRPSWSLWDTFPAGPAPNYKLGGCYALAKGSEIDYVGLASSKGGGIYADSGISRRLMSHVYLNNPVKGTGYVLRERWRDEVTGIYTLGFERDDVYLAPALELYLIRKMAPRSNTVGHALRPHPLASQPA